MLSQTFKANRQAVLLTWLLLVAGCSDNDERVTVHAPSHKPSSYTSAVSRLLKLHQEILDKPLKKRTVHAKHDHKHPHGDHSHGHGSHTHVRIDALEEMSDLVGWLPGLAADTELGEEPWNSVYKTSNELTVVLAQFSTLELDQRRGAFRKQSSEIGSQLTILDDIAERLRNHSGSAHQILN
ncbi:MAG: hypothetical protein CMJ78_19665 [Planctomycetaceae bacterium]|nr:hypothetical protein [Planctomycetaceae bacterium]